MSRPKIGGSSLWGSIQSVEDLASGVWFVTTAGHGGVKLDRSNNAKIPEPSRVAGGWYEEDCDWCIPFLVLDLDWGTKDKDLVRKIARETAATYHPAFLEEFDRTYRGRPEPGKTCRLTSGKGDPSIARGDTWADSEIKSDDVEGGAL